MNTKNIIIAFVLVIVSFYGGMKYGEHARSTRMVSFTNGNGTFAINTAGGARGGVRGGDGIINGEILSKDANTLTIKTRDGGSKIVLLSASTTIMKTTTGTAADLIVGKDVSGAGTTNSDGSITAGTIQLRTNMGSSTLQIMVR